MLRIISKVCLLRMEISFHWEGEEVKRAVLQLWSPRAYDVHRWGNQPNKQLDTQV